MWRVIGLAAAIGMAIQAQSFLVQSRVDNGSPLAAVILYAIAIALALLSLETRFPYGTPRDLGENLLYSPVLPLSYPLSSPWADWNGPWLFLALSCAALATLISAGAPRSPASVVLWIVGMALLVPAFAGREGGHFHLLPRAELALVAAILLAGFAARVYNLDSLPAVFHGDEAQSGLQARNFLAGQDNGFFTVGWYNQPIFSFALQGLVMLLAGDDVPGLRFASVLCGTAALLFIYLLVRLLFRPPTAAIATALAAIGYWPIHFSRIGINYIQTTLFEVMAWYFLLRGLRRRRPLDFAVCGVALGLGLLDYYASRLAPVLVAGVLGWYVLRERAFLRANRGNLLALFLAGLVTLAPQIAYFLQKPGALMSRTEDVWLFNNPQHTLSGWGTADPLQLLLIQTREALLVFNYKGDTSLQFGFSEPHLEPITAAMFLLGVAITLRRLWRWPYGLLHFWLWTTLFVGCVLTVDAPFGPRLVGAIPVPFIFAALPIAGLYHYLREAFPRRGRAVGLGLLVCLFSASGYVNYDSYVNRFNGVERPTSEVMELAKLLVSLQDYRVYLFATPEQSLGYGTVRFIARDTEGYDITDPAVAAPVHDEVDKDVAFLFWPSQVDRLAYVQHFYPDGLLGQHRDPAGWLILFYYLVKREEIRAGQGLVALYYPAGRWDGEPLARISGVVPGSPPPADLAYPLNVAWRGTLYVPDDARRALALTGPGATLWLDGQSTPPFPQSPIPQGPHTVEIRATLHDAQEQVGFYWVAESGLLVTVPRRALSIEPQAHGLLGTYGYAETDSRRKSQGDWQTLRVDPIIAFRGLNPRQPGPFAVEWRGCLRVPGDGLYAFRVTSHDGAQLFLDGQEFIADDHHGAIGSAQGQLYLARGYHDILLRGLFAEGTRWMELHWQPPGGAWGLLPTEVLIPQTTCPSED
jgi:4-amino-4-deoxy-L-arabinose transferase-like glycosyltransferase